jgi:hypothetical protein
MFVVVCLCDDPLTHAVMTSMGSTFHLLALMTFISAFVFVSFFNGLLCGVSIVAISKFNKLYG